MTTIELTRADRDTLDALRTRIPTTNAEVYLTPDGGDRVPARQQCYTRRKATVSGAFAVHTAENATDMTGPDTGAEGVANYIRTRSTAGSYHTVTDGDSMVRVGRYDWQMFHEGTGGNRHSIGLSVATEAARWQELEASRPDKVRSLLHYAALAAADATLWVRDRIGIDVPRRRITAAEYRRLLPGYCDHGRLDPNRRSDPGAGFPWDPYFEFTDYLLEETTTMAMNTWPGPDEIRRDVTTIYLVNGANPVDPKVAADINMWTRDLIDKGTGQDLYDAAGKLRKVSASELESPKVTYGYIDWALAS